MERVIAKVRWVTKLCHRGTEEAMNHIQIINDINNNFVTDHKKQNSVPQCLCDSVSL